MLLLFVRHREKDLGYTLHALQKLAVNLSIFLSSFRINGSEGDYGFFGDENIKAPIHRFAIGIGGSGFAEVFHCVMFIFFVVFGFDVFHFVIKAFAEGIPELFRHRGIISDDENYGDCFII